VRAKLNGRKSDIAYLRRTFFKLVFARDLCLAVVSHTGMYKIITQTGKFYLFIAARNAVSEGIYLLLKHVTAFSSVISYN